LFQAVLSKEHIDRLILKIFSTFKPHAKDGSMRKPLIPYLLFLFGTAVAFSSCVPQKRVVSAKKQLTIIDSQLQQHGQQLQVLDQQTKAKQDQNELDDTATSRIRKFIINSQNEIDSLVASNSILIGEAVVKRADWERLNTRLGNTDAFSKKINSKVLLVSELVSRNTVIKLDQDVLFGPGQYTVTPDVAAAIGKFFEPATQEIDLFVKKYPDFPLSIVITANGYADGTTISEGSSLQRHLKENLSLSIKEPDSKELNKELSRIRAKEVIELFKKFTVTRIGNGVNYQNVIYIFEGKGEKLPNPGISDYRLDDKRRRIVLLYWSVFPE
jgi:flagellar motor protein MotB